MLFAVRWADGLAAATSSVTVPSRAAAAAPVLPSTRSAALTHTHTHRSTACHPLCGNERCIDKGHTRAYERRRFAGGHAFSPPATVTVSLDLDPTAHTLVVFVSGDCPEDAHRHKSCGRDVPTQAINQTVLTSGQWPQFPSSHLWFASATRSAPTETVQSVQSSSFDSLGRRHSRARAH